jgi:hypothetical protein
VKLQSKSLAEKPAVKEVFRIKLIQTKRKPVTGIKTKK